MAEQANTKLLEGIAYFEKMLKVMPGDRTTLEFLSVAYEQLGDVEKQRTALIQLAEALLREKEYDAADAIGERLSGFSEADAQDMVRRIKSVRNPVQLKAVVRPGARPARVVAHGTACSSSCPAAPCSFSLAFSLQVRLCALWSLTTWPTRNASSPWGRST